nr:transposase [Roseomonas sp. SXEYE001]MCV4209168.1 transposase [Roseomonas sp. SXEYE001]
METGATSPWLYHSLVSSGLPAVLMDARHAHAALSMRPSKSDRSDARGLAEILCMGWYREVTAKSFSSHERLARLATRRRLVAIRADLDAQLRGLLKTFGLILGPGNTDALVRRAETLAEGQPVISGLVTRLAEVRRHVVTQVAALDRDIRRLVRSEPTLKRFMTVPGVGPITAVAFLSTIDEPTRFKHARDVGPDLGLTPRGPNPPRLAPDHIEKRSEPALQIARRVNDIRHRHLPLTSQPAGGVLTAPLKMPR